MWYTWTTWTMTQFNINGGCSTMKQAEVFEILVSNLSVTVSLPPHIGHFLIHRLALDPPETRTRSGGTPTLLWCFCCSGPSLCRTSLELGELPGAKHRKGQGQTYHAPTVSEHLEAARLCLQVSWIWLRVQVAAFKMENKPKVLPNVMPYTGYGNELYESLERLDFWAYLWLVSGLARCHSEMLF